MLESLSEYKTNSDLDELRGDAPAETGDGGFFSASDGESIFYQRWLPGDTPDKIIVCLHGMSGHGHYYSLAADCFSPRNIAVYAHDHRGHGLSGGHRGDIESAYRLIEDTDEFISLVKSIHPGVPVYILGESLGGLVAINYVARFPHVSSGMIALAPALKAAYIPGIREILLAPYYALCFLVCPESQVIVMSGREHRGIENRLHLEYHLNDPLVNRLIAPHALVELRKMMDYGNNIAPAEITGPVLLIQGENDTAVDHKNTQKFFRKLSSAKKKLKIYPEAGHNLISDSRSPRVLEFIFEWIESLS